MSTLFKFSLSCIQNIRFQQVHFMQRACYAKKVIGATSTVKAPKVGVNSEIPEIPVEKDPERLINYLCGSNIYKEGEDVKLKDDSEYPDWLWNLRLGRPPKLEDLDSNTLYYWRRVRKMNFRRANQLKKCRSNVRKVVNDFDFRGGHYVLK